MRGWDYAARYRGWGEPIHLDEGSARFASGVGGSSQVFEQPSVVVFFDPRNAMFAYQMEVGIIDDSQQARELPSLLGRDILDRWRMTYCPVDNLLAFEVLSADAML